MNVVDLLILLSINIQQRFKPMFHKYIRPTKRYADVIIPNDRKHDIAVDLIVVKIKQILGDLK